MKTIGWGIVQVPLVSVYRVCFCWKRPLVHAVSGSGWKMFIQSTLRILLVTLWGMKKIDYSLPQTSEKIIGLYFEFGILGLQVLDGMLTIMSSWFESMVMLYPILFVIPFSFIVDFIVKATCYAPLFLYPQVTAFGVFSLVEVWFRNFSQMYCWIAIISFIYKTKGKENPFEGQDEPKSKLTKKPSSVRSPFSRSSTLSIRGRRSFLLKSRKEEVQTTLEDASLLKESSSDQSVSDHEANLTKQKQFSDDDRSTLLGGETEPKAAIPDSASARSEVFTPDVLRSLSENFSFQRDSEIGEQPSQPRYKRVGGFVPEVLRTPSNAAHPPKTREVPKRPSEQQKIEKKKGKKPPSLPIQPPVGETHSSDTWRRPSRKSTTKSKEYEEPFPTVRPDQSFIV